MMPFFFTPYDILLIPAILIGVWAQFRVKGAYAKYSQIGTRSRVTGAQIAQFIMDRENIRDVGLECIPGEMTDHYDPRTKTVRLSHDVYNGSSIAALGIAAHEVGHVVQHARAYVPLVMRHFMYPVSSIGSTLAFPLILGGMIFSAKPIISIGIWLFVAAVAFTIVTLPVEFNASRRAKRALATSGYLAEDELEGVSRVLGAAAMTYVAAAVAAVLQLLRLIMIARSQD